MLMNIEERVREGSLSSAVVVCVVLEPKLEKSVVGVTNTLIGKQRGENFECKRITRVIFAC